MKFFLLIIVIILKSQALIAQLPAIEWAKSIKSVKDDIAYEIVYDKAGNSYVAGTFSDTIDLDPGVGTDVRTIISGQQHFFLLKLDANGNYIWGRTSQCDTTFGYVGGVDIALDSLGNICLTGQFYGAIDFGYGTNGYLLNATDKHVFIQKIDSAGQAIWLRELGHSSVVGINAINKINTIATDKDGSIYVGGKCINDLTYISGGNTNTISTPYPSTNFNDIFILKIDQNGDFLWAHTFGSPNYDHLEDITVDQHNNVYFVGNVWDSVDFDPGPNIAHIGHGGYIVKLDSFGNLSWAKAIGEAWGVCLDLLGNILVTGGVTGGITGTVDLDPGAGTAWHSVGNASDIFVLKLDAQGDYVWSKTFGAIYSDYGFSIATDQFGNVYTTGTFLLTMDIDPGLGIDSISIYPSFNPPWVYQDIFIQKLDSNGVYQWGLPFGGGGQDIAHAISVDRDLNIYTSGYYTESGRIGIGNDSVLLGYKGRNEALFFKLSQCMPTSSTLNVSACNSYLASNGMIYDSSGLYLILTTNAEGCDSTISLQLDITRIDSTVLLDSFALTAVATGFTYQWLDCSNGNSPIPGATNQSYTPTSNGLYAVEISDSLCSTVSDCYSFFVVGNKSIEPYSALQVYPNPTNNLLTIKRKDKQVIQIRLINSIGQVVLSKESAASSLDLELEIYPSGLYYLNIRRKDETLIYKVLKI